MGHGDCVSQKKDPGYDETKKRKRFGSSSGAWGACGLWSRLFPLLARLSIALATKGNLLGKAWR